MNITATSIESSAELEHSVLGTLLLDGTRVEDVLKERDPDTLFGSLEHIEIWRALQQRYLDGQEIDPWLIADGLQRAGKRGASSDIAKMMAESCINFSGDLALLVQRRTRREVLSVARTLTHEVVENTATAEEAAAKAMASLVELMRPAGGSTRSEMPGSIHPGGFDAPDAVFGDGEKGRGWLCQMLYPTPNPYHMREDEQRYCHRDLPDMSADELAAEQFRVRFILAFDPSPARWHRMLWFRERAKAVAEEMMRRDAKHR